MQNLSNVMKRHVLLNVDQVTILSEKPLEPSVENSRENPNGQM